MKPWLRSLVALLFLTVALAPPCRTAAQDDADAPPPETPAPGTFTVSSYNVENWLLMTRGSKTNEPKPEVSRQQIVSILARVKPDVAGLIEIGTTNDLAELRHRLKEAGSDYPHQEWWQAADPTRHVALLSKFPIERRYSRADYTYDLDGRPTPIQRGILDVLIRVNDSYAFRAIVVHLKSKREIEGASQAAMRLGEARLLRQHIDDILQRDPHANVLAVGDYNDTPESEPIHTVIGTGARQLFDIMPRTSTGHVDTHYWRSQRSYSRIDYLLASPGMSNEYVAGSGRLANYPGWLDASDHRCLYAKFHDRDIGPPPDYVALTGPDTKTVAPTRPRLTALLLLTIIIVVLAALVVMNRNKAGKTT
jgi:endonuclease/exonuclease/phosphatase family metal-dependent hydrolase